MCPQSLKAFDHIVASSAESIGTYNTGCESVKLHRPTVLVRQRQRVCHRGRCDEVRAHEQPPALLAQARHIVPVSGCQEVLHKFRRSQKPDSVPACHVIINARVTYKETKSKKGEHFKMMSSAHTQY
jgi:hypothetical protein